MCSIVWYRYACPHCAKSRDEAGGGWRPSVVRAVCTQRKARPSTSPSGGGGGQPSGIIIKASYRWGLIWLIQNHARILRNSLKPWHMGTHLRAISKSYPMNTNMKGLRYLSRIVAFLCFSRKQHQNWRGLIVFRMNDFSNQSASGNGYDDHCPRKKI